MESVSGVFGDSSPRDLSSIYRALDPHLPEIRVLKLLPSASFDAPLECRLVHRALHGDSDGYEALSYVWGGNEFTAEITLNNEPYSITPNLDIALRHLRRPSAERTLWVDALCINQHDLVERSRQVILMKDIYAHCTVDLAWMLTKADWEQQKRTTELQKRTKEAQERTKEPQKRTQEPQKRTKEPQKRAIAAQKRTINPEELTTPISAISTAFELIKKISFKDAETLARMRDGPFLGDSRDAVPGEFLLTVSEQMTLIQAFGFRDIYCRVWTMQEFAYAPKLKLVAGPIELDWDVVAAFLGDRPYADAFHAAFGHWGGGRALDLFFSGAVRVHDQRRALCDGTYKSTLLDVLARFQHNRATDPRDCVYGILGLVTEQHGIVVDYTKSAAQVFLDTALSIIHAQKNLDIFCQTAWMASPREENPHELPSWVPDFSDSVYTDAHRGILFAQRGIYAAGREYLSAPCRPINNQFLPVKAVVLGCFSGDYTLKFSRSTFNSVEEYRKALVRETYGHKASLLPELGAPFEWLEASGLGVDIVDGEMRYERTGETAIRAYWRTLLTDCGAYPIKRLSEQEILQTDDAFKSILGFLNDKLGVSASEEAQRKPMDTEEVEKQLIKRGDDDVFNETLLGLWESMPKTASTMWLRNYQTRTFSMTESGLYTMVRDGMVGDTIVSVEGAKVPLVLRKQESHDGVETYSLVGTAYVHGYMDGEALNLVETGELHEEEILLR